VFVSVLGMNSRMSTLKHLLSVRRLSTRVKTPAVVSAPRKPPLLSATDNDARQRTVKRSEGAGKDEAEGVDEEEEEEEDEEEWIAENRCLQEGSPLRASIAAAAAANKGVKRSLESSRNSPSQPQLQPQPQPQPEPRPVEPITDQTYEMLILAAISVSSFKSHYILKKDRLIFTLSRRLLLAYLTLLHPFDDVMLNTESSFQLTALLVLVEIAANGPFRVLACE
jgi:hypothetical protein